MMDLVFTVGEYNLVSMALNSFGVQLDEGLVPVSGAMSAPDGRCVFSFNSAHQVSARRLIASAAHRIRSAIPG